MMRTIAVSLLLASFAFGQTVTTIYDIQSGLIEAETVVEVTGLVYTGPGEDHYGGSGFFIQDGTGMYSGIYVYGSETAPAAGDSVTVTGTYAEYYDETEIGSVPTVEIINSGNALPTPEVLTLDQADWELWEGVLTQVQNVSRIDGIDYGEWWVTDGTDTLKIDNSGAYTIEPEEGDEFVSITGPITYTYGAYKLSPRTDADFIMQAPAVGGVSIDPAAPVDGEVVTVTATITHTISFTAALSYYTCVGTDTSETTDVAMTNTEGDVYTADIPAQTEGVTVTYHITATDTDGDSKVTDEYTYLVLPSGGVITPIYDIQYTTDPSGNSPLMEQTVTIRGVVTAEFWGTGYRDYLYVQDAEGPWNGILVYYYPGWDNFDFISAAGTVHTVAEGDSVTITGVVEEGYGRTRLNDITQVLAHGPAAANIVPSVVTPAQIKTGGSDAEAYEGCLVQLLDVTVANPDIDHGEWLITDGTDTCGVDDLWDYFLWPEQDQELTSVTGILDYAYSNYKIQPRLARDIVENGIARIQRVNQVLYSDLLAAAVNDSTDESYLKGDTITVQGVVTVATGLHYAGSGVKFIFEEEGGGPWSGLLCYSADTTALGFLPAGLKVQLTGVIFEYGAGDDYGGAHTEIDITQPVLVLGMAAVPGDTIPTSDLRVATTGEQWESVWITIADAYVIENELPYGQWSIANDPEGSGRAKIGTNSNDSGWDTFTVPPTGTPVTYLSGWPYNRHGYYADSTTYKIEPSYVTDVMFDLTAIDDGEVQIANVFELRQNYPNPFNPTTNISFIIANNDLVRLTIFDLKGREVSVLVNETMNAGQYSVLWNGMNQSGVLVSSGVYMYRLESGHNSSTGKMLLLR